VATPIGNLQDISLRALEVLAGVDLIAAEDTRHTALLLKHHGIRTPLTSYHEHNEKSRAAALIEQLKAGKSIALVSDAGTPLISDPGYRLVSAAAQESITVSPVPGPCAAIAALCVSGLPANQFHFEGFLPPKTAARASRLQHLKERKETIILYESGRRLIACLSSITEILSEDREVAVCRELTKKFETVLRGHVGNVLKTVKHDAMQQKGEFVIVIAGWSEGAHGPEVSEFAKKMFQTLCEELPASKAARITASLTGQPRKAIYALASVLSRIK
jgi:16S rRNA (cytidine1402-2'-O)-methyltransferase